MRSFEEIISDCINNKDNYSDIYNKCISELLETSDVKNLVEKLSKIYKKPTNYIKSSIELFFRDEEHSFEESIPEFKTFKNALNNYIRKLLGKQRIDYRIKKNEIESKMLSIDSTISDDSSTTLLDTIKDSKQNIEYNVENCENNEFLKELDNIGVKKGHKGILFAIYNLDNLYEISGIDELISELKFDKIISHESIRSLLMKYAKRSKVVANLIRNLFSFKTYAAIIEYLIKKDTANNKIETSNKKSKRTNVIQKLSLPELILDFNKIRNYLSVLLIDDSIKDKTAFIKRSFSNISSYEKDIHRIELLFNKKIFDIKDELKKYSPNKISKVYNVHTAPNLVSNFLIIDVLNKLLNKDSKENKVKLKALINELFPPNANYKEEEINNFRKYNLLPRLKELEEYGLVKIEDDKYALATKTLTEKQKKTLEFVVPFFCGIYPFASIGHFLANRLSIKDKFKFKAFNIANVLDDCILYDILTAINNKENIIINFKDKDKEKSKKIKPKEILIDNKTSLLKVVDDKKDEHYLNEIKIDKKPNNLIFSEIYSMFYKIFEEMVDEYNLNHGLNIEKIINKYNIYSSKNDKESFVNIAKELIPRLAKLKNIAIPLTKLELQWLKTIMQDAKFDLFVNRADKKELEELVKDTEPFNLLPFKVFDSKTKKYKSISDSSIPEGLDVDEFRKELNKLNSIIFNIQENSFPDFSNKSA